MLGNLFLAIAGFAIGWFVMFAVIAIVLRLYLEVEAFAGRKIAEDEGQGPALSRDGIPDGDQFPFHDGVNAR